MSRLTKKETNILSTNGYHKCEYLLNGTARYKAIDKLGQLEDIEEELGVDLVALFNGLKTKQSGLRYFNKFDAEINHMQQGWYVRMIMYGWIPIKDFVEALTREEL